MELAARSYATATGLALVASSVIAVTPVAAPPDVHISSAGVRLTSGGTDLIGGLENIPYNIYANIANMGYYETQALQEIAYALGPAPGTTFGVPYSGDGITPNPGGVPGWIPPGATVENGGVEMVDGQPYYALGGTSSWWMESMGNTWGWDNGNWPQVAGYISALLPFQPTTDGTGPGTTEQLAYQIQNLMQFEAPDGAHAGCEFECSSVLGYLGNWFHTPITDTYPTTFQGNVGVDGQDTYTIWSGQPAPPVDLSQPWTNFFNSFLAPPADNPIHPFNVVDYLTAAHAVSQDEMYDWFSPFVTGSFVYWGAPTLYTIPAVIGGFVHDLTGGLIPNEFAFPTLQTDGQFPTADVPNPNGLAVDQPFGAEPAWGPTSDFSTLFSQDHGLAAGFQYLLQGLEGYLNPSTYFGGAAAGASTLFGSLDPSTITADLSTLLGPELANSLASLF